MNQVKDLPTLDDAVKDALIASGGFGLAATLGLGSVLGVLAHAGIMSGIAFMAPLAAITVLPIALGVAIAKILKGKAEKDRVIDELIAGVRDAQAKFRTEVVENNLIPALRSANDAFAREVLRQTEISLFGDMGVSVVRDLQAAFDKYNGRIKKEIEAIRA